MSVFSSWDEFSSWLEGRGMFHMELGLERIGAALSSLNLSRPSFPAIQVLGTNGKGSCATFLASLGSAHSLSCGLFLSPHFLSIEERIKLNGRPVSRKIWLKCANLLMDSLKKDLDLTYFEFLTVLALLIFSHEGAEMAVFEAGLGGRNDATSAIPAKMHCITPIAMDHMAIIGPGLTDITRDKAHAIQAGSKVFSSPQSEPARKILADFCKQRDASLEFIPVNPQLPQPSLRGQTQRENASLALAAWRAFASDLGVNSIPEREREAIRKAFIPGRFQRIAASAGLPPLILDGAHNPHAVRSLLKNMEGEKPCAIIFSALADKDWRTSLKLINAFSGPAPMFIPLLDNVRAASPLELAARRNARYPDSACAFSGDKALAMALDAAARIPNPDGRPLLLTGSLYLLADFFRLYPRYLEAE